MRAAGRVDGSGANHGFYRRHGRAFKTLDFPPADNAKPRVDQLLAIDVSDIAVDFYTDSAGNADGLLAKNMADQQ